MQNNIPGNTPNVRSRMLGKKWELRKLWNVPEAVFVYALYVDYEEQTAPLVPNPEFKEDTPPSVLNQPSIPDWDNATTNTMMGPAMAQGSMGDLDWAQRTAEHFNIDVPEVEWEDTANESEA